MRDNRFFPGCLASCTVLLVLSLAVQTAKAREVETMESVLARMQAGKVTKIAYHETRYLELMSEPWKGSGHFYARPPDILIREQREPTIELMAIDDDALFYFDPQREIRHSGELDDDDSMQMHISAFRALVNGDLVYLRAHYDLSFVTVMERWNLILEDKSDPDALLKVTVSGQTGKAADKLQLFLPDGDHSLYELGFGIAGAAAEADAARLISDIKGP